MERQIPKQWLLRHCPSIEDCRTVYIGKHMAVVRSGCSRGQAVRAQAGNQAKLGSTVVVLQGLGRGALGTARLQAFIGLLF